MSKERFERSLRIAEQHRLLPILAVVPDNQDPDLTCDNPDPDFWKRISALQAAGATIAMHGYRHLCRSAGRSLLNLNRKSEFAGIPEEIQRDWIRSGLDSLCERGIRPRLFVAPRHGFDFATLHALVNEGLPILSDGFALRPFTRAGVVCIPQQLWAPVAKHHGLWTICLHTNHATNEFEQDLDRFLSKFAHQFTTFDDVIAGEKPNELSWSERTRESIWARRRRQKSR